MEPRPYDMFVYECSIDIEAPPAVVWAIVGDLGTSADWAGSGQVRSMTQTTPGDAGVGTRYIAQEHILVPFKAESEIVAYEPNRLICWTARPVGPKVPAHRWAFLLEPTNGGTRLTHQVRAARASGLPRLIQAIGVTLSGGTASLVRGMEKTLVTIKTRSERNAAVESVPRHDAGRSTATSR
ncbi:MAG: hypothetical protein NVSMB22_15100 [Chloroflexota bacterium]